jgi:hypothetical protein
MNKNIDQIKLRWSKRSNEWESGGGEYFENTPENMTMLESWVEEMNKKYPELKHWIQVHQVVYH